MTAADVALDWLTRLPLNQAELLGRIRVKLNTIMSEMNRGQ